MFNEDMEELMLDSDSNRNVLQNLSEKGQSDIRRYPIMRVFICSPESSLER